jgi:hypothetical protein
VPGNPAWTRLEETMPSGSDKRWRTGLPGAGPRRPRIRLGGCLLWLLGLLIVLVILSLLFGGFQKGTRTGLGRPAAPAGALPAAGAGAGAYQP